jgi:ABC-2 type transport system permease protein
MQSVLEEKTTRVVEVLVSSLKPFQLMAGKLIGVGGASLFQFLIWGVSVKLLLSQRGAVTGGGFGDTDAAGFFQLPPVPAATIAIVIVFFVGGFLLYSSMFAAVGAMSNSLQEAQQGQQPVTMLLVLSLVSMFAMLNNPGSTYAVVLSLIPFTAPIAMPVRWTAGSLPVWELVASMAMLGIGIVVIVWVAARIYRVGILMTGKRPSVKEVVRWVRVG